MSKLLDEACRLESEALDALYNSYKMPFEDGYFQGVEDMRKLIEKHEKPQLTEEQEKIYRALTLVYEDKDEMHPEDLSNIINTINIVINFYVGKDRNLIPALNKFLEEVEE
ncbi:hypothetical protein LQF59_06940 [Tetragenococcus koreensis]|uniref:hypothetical protein n=1 Tax=Tetragenococcus koreensis TaxID=290335 RepID=UPI001F2B031B|nr:hypothetical protein [Tetragenococcus koreensis]MCF1614797.1 hypothetical protein [Tetragenococcus koreensis]MCF1624637.1 hypothetical protein [Tetragenococcus koreensis]